METTTKPKIKLTEPIFTIPLTPLNVGLISAALPLVGAVGCHYGGGKEGVKNWLYLSAGVFVLSYTITHIRLSKSQNNPTE